MIVKNNRVPAGRHFRLTFHYSCNHDNREISASLGIIYSHVIPLLPKGFPTSILYLIQDRSREKVGKPLQPVLYETRENCPLIGLESYLKCRPAGTLGDVGFVAVKSI